MDLWTRKSLCLTVLGYYGNAGSPGFRWWYRCISSFRSSLKPTKSNWEHRKQVSFSLWIWNTVTPTHTQKDEQLCGSIVREHTTCCYRYGAVAAAAAAAKSLQSCLTLCDPIDGSPPGSPIPGILQARTLEWVAISFSNAWKWKVKVKSLSRVRLLVAPWTAAHQAPPSMGFSRQEYWSGLPFPSPMHESEKWKWSHSVMPK